MGGVLVVGGGGELGGLDSPAGGRRGMASGAMGGKAWAQEEDDGERGSGEVWLCSFSPCEWRRQEENEGRELGIERWDRSG